MMRVLYPCSRLMVAGAVVLAGTIISSTAEAACDSGAALGCMLGSGKTDVSKTSDAVAGSQSAHPRRAGRHLARASRLSQRSRRHASARRNEIRLTRAEAHAAPAIMAQHVSASVRRFREFVNPRSIALNPIDELKRPEPDSAALVTFVAYPTIGLEPSAGSVLDTTAFREEVGEPDLARLEEASPTLEGAAPTKVGLADGTASPGQTQAQSRPASRTAIGQDQAPLGPTWLQLIFVTWGGILTLASAVRLFVG
jgi:hypothetical protein